MAELADLETIRDSLLTAIKAATASPKPNYNIDGQSVSWSEYLAALWKQYREVSAQINAADPYEEVSQGYT